MNRSRRSAFASFLLYWVALGGASCAPSNDEAVGLRGPAAESAVYGVFPEVAPRWTEWPHPAGCWSRASDCVHPDDSWRGEHPPRPRSEWPRA